jgi:glycerol-1-phosphate dehydrogenase [NAD(P)+]
VSNLTAIEDWRLAHDERGEPVDGLAVTFARTAAEAVLHRTDGVESDAFLTALAEALVLSGMAMAAAGSSRPSSGADHEIMHAIDALFPGTANHGELAGVGALFSAWLRGNQPLAEQIDTCLRRHGLPRLPADVGLSDEQFAEAVGYAPQTRPDRYTILEHLDLGTGSVRERVAAYIAAYGR